MSIDSKKLAYGHGGGDEAYTPEYGVTPILKYIPEDAIVWCPFDKVESQFVQQIGQTNQIVMSHLDTGQDFLTWEPEVH